MFDKNSTSGNGVATITYTFDINNYKMASLTFNDSQTIPLSDKAENTFYPANNCEFSYKINSGNVVVTVRNISSDLNVKANIEKSICTTTLQVNFNNVINEQTQIIINLLTGTKDSYSAMQQIVVSKKEELSSVVVELQQGQTYTITVSRPYTWGITYTALDDGDGTQIGDYYEFTTSGQTRKHKITITGGGIPNIWVVI